MLILFLFSLPFASSFEFWVGARDLRPTSNVVLWLNGSSWADGISVGFPPLYNALDLQKLSTAGLRLLPCIHSSLETMQRQLFDDPPAVPDTLLFSSAYTRTLPDFQTGTTAGPKPFFWWSLTEDDSSGVGFPYTQLSVPARIGYAKSVPFVLTAKELRDALQEQRLGQSAKQKLSPSLDK